MARRVRRLAARSVESLKKPGRHADGDGLYLVVDPSGARRWLFMFRWKGKLKEMGLGPVSGVSLADARELAGFKVEFVTFNGDHELPDDVLAKGLDAWLGPAR